MKTLMTIMAMASVMAFSSTVMASNNVKCSHRVSSGGNDLFKNTNPEKTVKGSTKAPAKAAKGTR